jgi:Zn ribbon nucleic-acid-binding protein
MNLRGRMNLTDTRVPVSKCPVCGEPNDMAASIEADVTPKPGDFSVCLECGHVMVYDYELKLREPTSADLIEIAGDKKLLFATQVVGWWRDWKPRR